MSTSETVYYIGINGVRSGPFPEAELRARLAQGTLSDSDLCWQSGWSEWKSVAQAFPGASSATPTTPPLSPPPQSQPFVSFAPRSSPVSIDGKYLVVPKDLPFPRVCIRTGATDNLIHSPLRRELTWHNPAVYLGILLNVLVYLVLALIFRKKSTHAVYLSREARSAQIKWHLANWGLFIGFWILLGVGISNNSNDTGGVLALAAFVSLFASIVIYFWKIRLLYAVKIDETHARIGGIPPAVLTKLVQAWD